ncbi:MAG TPA: hypothetical protein K8V00_06915 [Ligilactobacillus acidipiscis]|uniref:Uncharacterized protein n=1 Tax=Ligilactobacillus acidipiscis TaxID=89059 RepID=A0A921F8K8_9LACO|nr:hypothetical protein [Ligilactobacillus acidipiscis]
MSAQKWQICPSEKQVGLRNGGKRLAVRSPVKEQTWQIHHSKNSLS